MNPTVITLTVVGIIIIIAAIAWFLYKANFRAKEITMKVGPLEAKMERESKTDPKTGIEKQHTEASQEATDGGRIKDTTIKAPAESGAKLKQKAEGEGSSITNSGIELK